MISKVELADLVIINVSGGAPNNKGKHDPREYFKYIGMAVSALVNAAIEKNEKPGADGAWLKTFEDVEVLWDEKRKVCFFYLPCPIVNVPNDEGLYSITPMEDETTQHIITKKGQFAVFDNLEASNTGPNEFVCYVEGDKVVYPDMPQSKAGCPLLVTVIPDPDGLEDNDPINVPGIMVKTLIDLVIDMSKGQVTYHNKKLNDQNPNTP